jgi:hypothetical protein
MSKSTNYKLPAFARDILGEDGGVPWDKAISLPAMNAYSGLVNDSFHALAASRIWTPFFFMKVNLPLMAMVVAGKHRATPSCLIRRFISAMASLSMPTIFHSR